RISMSTDVSVLPSTVAASSVMPPLPDDPAALKQMILELLDALKKSQHECEGLQQRLDQLLRRLYGPKAERFDPNQPWLLPELAPTRADNNGATATRRAHFKGLECRGVAPSTPHSTQRIFVSL